MPVRIQEIHVDAAGPLTNLKLKPGQVTLIYGGNESGKTYLVELLIRSLFSVKQFDPELRKTELVGHVMISGIKEDNGEVKLNQRSKKKLEELIIAQEGKLPSSISRLMVIRAGEPSVESGSTTGVNRTFLLQYLSNQGFLTRILNPISVTIQRAQIDPITGNMTGENKGEFKTRAEKEAVLKRLNEIRERVHRLYSGGVRAVWRARISIIEQELARLEQAKRHLAWQQYQAIQTDQGSLASIPGDQLDDLSKKIALFVNKEEECQKKNEKYETSHHQAKDYPWLEQAVGTYERCLGNGAGQPSYTFFYLAMAGFILAAICGLLGSAILAIAFAIIGAVLGFVFLGKIRASWQKAGNSKELEGIAKEFSERFNTPLAGLAMLKEFEQKLKQPFYDAQHLKNDVEGLSTELSAMESQIISSFRSLGYTEIERASWDLILGQLKSRLSLLGQQIQEEERRLDQLRVPPSDYLPDDPGCSFSHERVDQLTVEREDLQSKLNEEEDELKRLRQDISNVTGQEITADWEFLIHELEKKREMEARGYRELCAKMLAEKIISTVVEDLRKQEETRIEEALNTAEVNKSLLDITGHYQRLGLSGDALAVWDGDVEYPLAELSTGTVEQVLLALRVNLASKAFGNQPAFLILDDAFQHSDWNRRERLVDEVLCLAQGGWQVIYLTMDNHIRDLFQGKISPILSEDYQYFDLTPNPAKSA